MVTFTLPYQFRALARQHPKALYRGVLPDKDIINITDENVTFRYKEGGTNIIKTRTLPVLKFLWLILQHVLPKGLQHFRDYGFLHGNAKKTLQFIQLLLHVIIERCIVTERPVFKCPICSGAMEIIAFIRPTKR